MQRDLAKAYLAAFNAENSWRLRVQSDIVKDVATIMGDYSDKMRGIEDFLEGETLFEELELLREARKTAYGAQGEQYQWAARDFKVEESDAAWRLVVEQGLPSSKEMARDLRAIRRMQGSEKLQDYAEGLYNEKKFRSFDEAQQCLDYGLVAESYNRLKDYRRTGCYTSELEALLTKMHGRLLADQRLDQEIAQRSQAYERLIS